MNEFLLVAEISALAAGLTFLCVPQTVLAADRLGDSPVDAIMPLMVYLSLIITRAQRYQKNAGSGTLIAHMLPQIVTAIP
jgi:aminobenzoyl-glutamate transport protein